MSRIARRARAVAPALVLLVTLSSTALVAPPATRAADITFGTPRATTTYGDSIDFSVAVTTSGPLARVELRLLFPDTIGPFVVEVPVSTVSATGTRQLRYTLDLGGDGHLVPNTTIVATWAAYASIGASPVTSSSESVHYQDTSHEWRTVKGDLMTVHWYEGTQAFAAKALRIGEQAIRETAALLGVTESRPVDFYIYGDEASFRDALGPGTRENVGGQAHSDIRTLFALITPDEIDAAWVGIVVPHELVHLVFDTAVRNPYRFPPRWFNEGLAVYLSEGYTDSDRGRVSAAVSSGDLIPLVALGGQFPTDADKTYLAYAEAVSAIDYLVRDKGQPALIALVKAYRDGLTDDEAFTRALGEDLAAFQDGWLGELGARAPQRYGPQPAPPGPLPSGWSGSAPTSAPGAPSGSPVAGQGGSPGASTSATPGSTAGGSGGDPMPALLVIAVAVIAVVGVGLAVARRRGAGP